VFAGRVEPPKRERQQPSHRANVDAASVTLSPHYWKHSLCQPHHSEEIRLELLTRFLHARLFHRASERVARVVHYYPDPPCLLQDRFNGIGAARVICHIHLNEFASGDGFVRPPLTDSSERAHASLS